MKAALFALALIPLSAQAESKVAQTLSLDLDGDGQADLVQIVDNGGDFNQLEITLSKTGQKLSYGKFVRRFDESKGCSEWGSHELAAGPGHTFLWTENRGDLGECRYEDKNQYRIGLGADGLRLEQANLHFHSWSMGGPAPTEDKILDFMGKTISVAVEEHRDGNVSGKAKESMRAGCTAKLEEMDAAGGVPSCALQQAWFMVEEIYPNWTPKGTKVCPRLEGYYSCKWVSGSDTYTSKVLTIHRVENSANRYDISESSTVLIADGKKRPITRFEGDVSFETTTCRRADLLAKRESWLRLEKNDPRKPLYDRLPYTKERTLWTQLDIEGRHFAFSESSQYLNEDGTYRDTSPRLMDCVKVEDKE